MQQLDYIGGFYLRGLRVEVVKPVPYYPENKNHLPSYRFNIRHGLLSFFLPDLHMRAATKLLGIPKAKELIEQMLISASPHSWIVAALKRIGYGSTLDAVTLYKSHYFNVEGLDATEMRTLLRLRFQEGADSTDPEEARVAAAYEKAAWMDPRLAAANSPIAPLATVVNAIRVGYMPDPAGLPRMLSVSRVLGAVRMNEAMMTNGRDDAQRAAYYSQVVKVANEVLQTTGNPEEDFHSKLAALTVKTDEAPVPMLEELSGGQHTGTMEPDEGDRNAGPTRQRKKRRDRGGGTPQSGSLPPEQ